MRFVWYVQDHLTLLPYTVWSWTLAHRQLYISQAYKYCDPHELILTHLLFMYSNTNIFGMVVNILDYKLYLIIYSFRLVINSSNQKRTESNVATIFQNTKTLYIF